MSTEQITNQGEPVSKWFLRGLIITWVIILGVCFYYGKIHNENKYIPREIYAL